MSFKSSNLPDELRFYQWTCIDNGKVEKSHRNDNERFYNNLKFYFLEDLRYQAKLYLKRSNNIPKAIFNYKTPNEKRLYLK